MSGPYVIEVERDTWDVVVEERQGPPGPPGSPGTGASGAETVPFGFGDAPRVIYTAPPGGSRLVGADLSIRTAFDGAAPAVTVSGVLATADANPRVADVYSQLLDAPLAAGQTLTLVVAADGSTQGSGVLTLFFA